ncbi:hypothetical protein ACFFLM_02710 [Deinococcus oregonensis]|uniref:Uncharacterized protein n=1 Tax=Deinococcus oregonensis TaxID=1805970 RepID=A0ABV6ATS3_9DEIO
MRRYVCLVLALLSGGAGAHPVDEMVQGAYLTLTPGAVQLELDLTPGVQVSAPVLKSLDANADERVTSAEARVFAVRVLAQSTLTLNGAAVRWTVDEVTVPPFQNLKLGSDTIKIYATAKRPDQPGAGTLVYQNRYQPVKSQWTANVFLQPAAGWNYAVTGQSRSNDGRQLAVKYRITRL